MLLSILTRGMTVTLVMWLPIPSSMVAGALKRGTATLHFLLGPPSAYLSQSPEIPIRCVGPMMEFCESCNIVTRYSVISLHGHILFLYECTVPVKSLDTLFHSWFFFIFIIFYTNRIIGFKHSKENGNWVEWNYLSL